MSNTHPSTYTNEMKMNTVIIKSPSCCSKPIFSNVFYLWNIEKMDSIQVCKDMRVIK